MKLSNPASANIMSVAEEAPLSGTNGKSEAIPIRKNSVAELLQNANGSNPSSPMNSRGNSLYKQSSFENRQDDEIINPDPKSIDQLFQSGPNMSENGSNGHKTEVQGKVNDEHDAWPSNPFSRRDQNHQHVAAMPVEKDSEYYNMNHKRRGLAFIFNHKHFDPRLGLKQRNGTDADRDNLRITLRQLDFEVNVYDDLPFKEIERILEQASAETDHSDADCILIAVLSHGELGILYATDHAYKPDRLWTPFNLRNAQL